MNGRCVLTDEIGNPFGILVGIGDGEGATGVEIFLTVDKEERCHGLLAVLFEERQRLAGERLRLMEDEEPNPHSGTFGVLQRNSSTILQQLL